MKQKRRGIGYLPLLTLRVLWRRRGASLLLAAVAAIGVYAGCGLQSLVLQQQRAIKETVENTVIHCTVTDVRGMNADHLNLFSTYVEILLGRRAYRDPSLADIDKAVTNIRVKGEWELAQPADTVLCRLLNIASDDRLAGAKIAFGSGWKEESLMGSECICLLPEGMAAGETIDVAVKDSTENAVSTMHLRVAGRVAGGPENVIYCPFFMPWKEGQNMAFTVPSCTFDIRDTARLEECKEKLFSTPFFIEPSVDAVPTATSVGVLVHDEIYLQSLKELRANLRTLRLLRPLLLALMGGISFFAGFLINRRRGSEFAVLRCLGLHRRTVFGQVLGEQCALGFFGGALGMTAAWAGGLTLSAGGLALSAAATAMFVLGAALCAGIAASGNPMELMKTEE